MLNQEVTSLKNLSFETTLGEHLHVMHLYTSNAVRFRQTNKVVQIEQYEILTIVIRLQFCFTHSVIALSSYLKDMKCFKLDVSWLLLQHVHHQFQVVRVWNVLRHHLVQHILFGINKLLWPGVDSRFLFELLSLKTRGFLSCYFAC